MNKKLKSIPKFRSEAEERRFWETHDSGDYIDWSKAERSRQPPHICAKTFVPLDQHSIISAGVRL
jgi:hypothetical protein